MSEACSQKASQAWSYKSRPVSEARYGSKTWWQPSHLAREILGIHPPSPPNAQQQTLSKL